MTGHVRRIAGAEWSDAPPSRQHQRCRELALVVSRQDGACCIRVDTLGCQMCRRGTA